MKVDGYYVYTLLDCGVVKMSLSASMPGLVFVTNVMMLLSTDCQLSSEEGRRQLCSANSWTCVVRRTYSNFGDRCFTAAGARLWNSLTAGLRQTDIGYEKFKQLLETYFFGHQGHSAL